MSGRVARLILASAAVVVAVESDAQSATRVATPSAPQTAVVTPGARYAAGWLHRLLLGGDYRDLWTAPIEVPVLDLRAVGGGLRPTQRGGSMQTISLRFAGGDGREYVFRPVAKDFAKTLPAELRGTLVHDIVQDQAAGYHPGAPLVVSRLLDETGIHHPRPRLVVMPNDSLLGEFRADFAGVLGTIEERPGADFDESPESLGATDVVSTERLWERMRRSASNVVDVRAFLSARLFDILVGDRDRHRDQWRWARFSATPHALWEPVPRDRDMPFARFEGIGPWAIRSVFPQLVTFAARYPDMVWLNWNGREVDRRLLVGLERAAWDSSVAALQAQVTDAAIDSAIGELPPPFVQLNGAKLRRTLIERRERLPAAAASYYRILAREVDLNATDDRDVADITRDADGSVRVTLTSRDGADGTREARALPLISRRFETTDTREIRIFLHGGADRVVVRGASRRDILLRIVGGDGNDTVVDSVPDGDHALRVYDSAGDIAVVSARKIGIERDSDVVQKGAPPQSPERDWGSWQYMLRGGSLSPGRGLVASITSIREEYAFRTHPFARRTRVGLDFSMAELRPRLTYSGEFRSPTPGRWLNLDVMASGIELIRFHGFGNQSAGDRSADFYRVFQNLFRVGPSWVAELTPRVKLALGAVAQYTSTRDDANTLVGTVKPYGADEFGEVGATASLAVDHRDVAHYPSRGFHFAAAGTVVPAIWDASHPFARGSVEAATYASVPGRWGPTLALRARGEHVWGTFPFHDAAFIGGVSTLRGWDEQRFAGRSSLSGSAELRMPLGKVSLIVPAEAGVLGFADLARVFADGDRSNAWHGAVGGGVWLAPLLRRHSVSLSVARGKERFGLYAASGFSF